MLPIFFLNLFFFSLIKYAFCLLYLCKGEQMHTTCQDISKPVRIECEIQFFVGDIKLSLEPEYKTDCKEEAIETDLNYVCRNNFNKSEKCYYSVFERMNKSEDCYDFTKNVSVKYLCIGECFMFELTKCINFKKKFKKKKKEKLQTCH